MTERPLGATTWVFSDLPLGGSVAAVVGPQFGSWASTVRLDAHGNIRILYCPRAQGNVRSVMIYR